MFACVEAASGEPRVLKCYRKAALQPRHRRNLMREVAAMRACTAHGCVRTSISAMQSAGLPVHLTGSRITTSPAT